MLSKYRLRGGRVNGDLEICHGLACGVTATKSSLAGLFVRRSGPVRRLPARVGLQIGESGRSRGGGLELHTTPSPRQHSTTPHARLAARASGADLPLGVRALLCEQPHAPLPPDRLHQPNNNRGGDRGRRQTAAAAAAAVAAAAAAAGAARRS
eukprot:scaffold1027_cov413-Prasinococcus_capsulatus_cf.AAC.6